MFKETNRNSKESNKIDKILLRISQSDNKLFHYNITRRSQYLVSSYDGFKTSEEAEDEGLKIIKQIEKNDNRTNKKE